MENMDVHFLDLEDLDVPWWWSCRLWLALLSSAGFLFVSCQQILLEAVMPCLLNKTRVGSPAAGSANFSCPLTPSFFDHNVTFNDLPDGEFSWRREKRQVLLQCYLWGFLISQVMAGYLSTRFGGKFVIGVLVCLSSTCTLVMPLSARTHFFFLLVSRFVAGLGAGGCMPAMFSLLGRWAPPSERSQLVSISYSGVLLAHIVTYPLTALLCRHGFDGGWPSIFYLLGGVGVIWVILWLLLAHDSPTSHQRISQLERKYITLSLYKQADFLFHRSRQRIPWDRMLTSRHYVAIAVSSFANRWGLHTFSVDVPEFLLHRLGVQVWSDPLLRALPFCFLWFWLLVSAVWTDKLQSRGVLSTGKVRRMMQGLGTAIPGVLLVLMSFLSCGQSVIAISTQMAVLAFASFQYNGFFVNVLDLAPRYAAIFLASASTFGSLADILAPLLTEKMVTSHSREQWQTVFWTSTAIHLLACAVYVLTSSGTLQPWATCTPFHPLRNTTLRRSHTLPVIKRRPRISLSSASLDSAPAGKSGVAGKTPAERPDRPHSSNLGDVPSSAEPPSTPLTQTDVVSSSTDGASTPLQDATNSSATSATSANFIFLPTNTEIFNDAPESSV